MAAATGATGCGGGSNCAARPDFGVPPAGFSYRPLPSRYRSIVPHDVGAQIEYRLVHRRGKAEGVLGAYRGEPEPFVRGYESDLRRERGVVESHVTLDGRSWLSVRDRFAGSPVLALFAKVGCHSYGVIGSPAGSRSIATAIGRAH